MIKKVFTVLLGLLVAGTMISVDCSDAAVKRNRVRPRTVSKPVTQPAPTATQQTTAAPAAAATATAPKTTTTAPAATVTQPTTAQGMPYGQTMAAPQSQGSGMGSALLMGRENVPELSLIVVQLIVNIQDGAAGIAEDGIHLLLQQALDEYLCAGHFHVVTSFLRENGVQTFILQLYLSSSLPSWMPVTVS